MLIRDNIIYSVILKRTLDNIHTNGTANACQCFLSVVEVIMCSWVSLSPHCNSDTRL